MLTINYGAINLIMIEKEVTILNKVGMHMRPASLIVKTASQYDADFYIIQEDGMKINGKSILSLIGLEAAKGAKLIFQADGEDEDDMLNALVTLVKEKFYED